MQPLLAAAMVGLRAVDIPVLLAPPERLPGDFVLQIELGLVYAAGAETKAKPPMLRALTAGLLRTRRGVDVLSDDPTPQPELTRLQHLAVSEQGEQEKPPTPTQWRELAKRAVEDTAHSLGAQLRLSGLPSKDLLRPPERCEQGSRPARCGAADLGPEEAAGRAGAGDAGAKG